MRIRSLLLSFNFVALLALAGCTTAASDCPTCPDDSGTGPEDTTASGAPDLVVTANSLDFSWVQVDREATASLTLRNDGDQDLTVHTIEILGLDARAFNAAETGSLILLPGETTTLPLRFRPDEAREYQAQLALHSNVPDHPTTTVTIHGVGTEDPPCRYEFEPPMAVLPLLALVGEESVGHIRLRNTSDYPCSIDKLELTDQTDPSFSLPDSVGAIHTLAAGTTLDIPVIYTPESNATAQDRGWLALHLSSPERPDLTVQLLGYTTGERCLGGLPPRLDFRKSLPYPWEDELCALPEKDLTVYNGCDQEMVIDSIGLDAGGAFTLDPVTTPHTLAPGNALTFPVAYHPSTVGPDQGSVRIDAHPTSTPDDQWEVAIALDGPGEAVTTHEEVFTQLRRPQSDILLVIDDSSSMAQGQASLRDNLRTIFRFIEYAGSDWHLAVTTTSLGGDDLANGRFLPLDGSRPRVITSTMANGLELFLQNADVGTAGSDHNQGIEAAYRALTSPLVDQENRGFLREDAYLSIIIIADSDDRSPEEMPFYRDTFAGIKRADRPNLLSVSTVVGPVPDGCQSDTATAEAAPRFLALARGTGGIDESICVPHWSQAFAPPMDGYFGYKSSFFLSVPAQAGTIRVTVDGQEMAPVGPHGNDMWRYDAGAHSVIFSPLAIPEPGAEIRVHYQTDCY